MKLNFKKIFLVGLAFLTISMFWQTYDAVITKILIDKFGLNQLWSGVVMALDNVLALLLIPVFGAISDRTNHKRGRRTPFIIIGTVVAAFAFMALTFSDNVQKSKIEAAQTSMIEDYNLIYNSGDDLTVAEWKSITDSIDEEWNQLLNEGIISQENYNKITSDIYTRSVPFGENITIDEDQIFADNEISDDELISLEVLFSQHANKRAWIVTTQSPGTLIVFIATLFVALLAMSAYRSPAVALMPDVTIKPMRSKANAIINLMGSLGAILALGTLMLFGLDRFSYVNYTPAFITIGVLMLVILTIFLFKVKEPELVAEKVANEIKFDLVEEEDKLEDLSQEEIDLSKSKKTALILILLSVTLWFFGYNAVTTKISDYAPNVLKIGYAIPIYIAHGAALIAFIPIGILATRVGRKKMILFGIILLTFSFGSVYFLTPDTAFFMYAIFGLTGIAWATINVNSYPMVVELAKGSNVGKYTGYYYMFSMGAQILTPALSGALMDALGTRTVLFPYATLFVAAAFFTMLFVKHGDIKINKKGSIIENFDVDMD
ncbi:MAG: MFS transporter [Tenericutes bacterium]|jgi:maltose/moltooligosaccharide transporter|nr:MFS transporter [Mycoplasmatota bacterium]